MGWFGGKKTKDAGGAAKNNKDDNDNDHDDIISLDDRGLDAHANGAGGATVAVPDDAAADENGGPRVSVKQSSYYEEDDGIPFAGGGGTESDVPNPKKNATCPARFFSELHPCRGGWFAVRDAATGRTLDIPESFAPASCYAFLWKLFCAATAVLTLAWSFVDDDSEAYFVLAYFTNWGVLFCCLYFCFGSVLNTVLAARTPQPPDDGSAGWRISAAWFLYALGVHTTASATVFYWPFVFDPGTTDITFIAISGHGGLLLLMLVDGMLVNRIPLRWQHWYGIFLVDVLYVGWTLIHGYVLDVGNPNESDNDPDTNDDAIYRDVNEWENDWQTALIYSVINCFALSPLVYLVLWTLSNGLCWNRRKYVDSCLDDGERDQRPTVDDVQEGSIFAKWR